MSSRNKSILIFCITLFIISGAFSAGATTLSQQVFNVVDTNADPNIFEAFLSADEQNVNINGTTVHALIYKDTGRVYADPEPNGIPIPQIVVNVGDEVIVHLTNDLAAGCAAVACNTSIHWHGIELDNDSDGTGVTQTHLEAGDTYIYRFIPPRPGVFWFHPHMLPGPQVFAGMYGALIVKDPNESTLQGNGTIPPEASTHTVVLSDIEFNSSGDVGYVFDDDFDSDTPDVFRTWYSMTDGCKDGNPDGTCDKIGNAETVLVNGQTPTAGIPTITAKSGEGIRLRFINTATNRYFRLAVTGNGSDNNIYRIGGEGGFLDHARLEGGTQGTWDTKYSTGEIMVPASGRSDVVIVPTGADGDIITLSNPGYQRGGPSGNNSGGGDLLHIVIGGGVQDPPFTITNGQDILGAGVVEDLKGVTISDFYLTPPVFDSNPGAGNGSTNQIITMAGISPGITGIDAEQGHFEDSGSDYTLVPYQATTRYARTGDTLEFTISNDSNQHHPFHHHGFSFQPVRVIDFGPDRDFGTSDDVVLYEYDYNEFVDVIDVFSRQAIVVRMRIDDRPIITDFRGDTESSPPAEDQHFPDGGAAGRWVFHCHIFLHATIGMISELVILPNSPPVADAGLDQIAECTSADGGLATMDGTGSSDPDGDDITFLWEAPGIVFDDPTSPTATATFPLGSTEVTLTVSDGSLEDTDTMTVVVEDTIGPAMSIGFNPDTLWPPDHSMRDITATVLVTDACDPNPTYSLTSATSSEFDDGTGDGHTTDDIAGTDLGTPDVHFQLRAERDGARLGRTYTITYTGTDGSGNSTEGSATIVAPHN